MAGYKKYLYLVVLGGRIRKANIELHDVRWVIGSNIQDTFDDLRKNWFGSISGLHIDSYKKVHTIDGYRINLKNLERKKKLSTSKELTTKKYLCFVNIGGYNQTSMQEIHEFGLIVASKAQEAVNKAKSKWLNGCKKKHKDDCQLIECIDDWAIELIPEKGSFEEKDYPDWNGYMRIDKYN